MELLQIKTAPKWCLPIKCSQEAKQGKANNKAKYSNFI